MPNTAQFDIISIGDSTIDTFIRIHDASVECDINHKECKICLKYGDKIPVDAISHSVAGNAANFAAGTSSLGLKTAIYTNLGNDSEGELIKNVLTGRGIAPDYIEVKAGKSSNSSAIITFQGERTALVYHQPWFYHLPNLSSSKWVYLTSMAETFVNSNIIDEVSHYCEMSEAKLVFSPGTFQIKANVKRYPKLLERCEVFVVNLEEAKRVLEIDLAEQIEPVDLLSKLLLLGPKIVVITDGKEGSWASDGTKRYKTGIFPVSVVEKTGAGDAYTSAFVAGLYYGLKLEEAMIWGTINSAHVISRMGPMEGLMTKEEIERYRGTVPKFKAAQI